MNIKFELSPLWAQTFLTATDFYFVALYNLRYADDSTVMAESEEELKNLLMKVNEESENFG